MDSSSTMTSPRNGQPDHSGPFDDLAIRHAVEAELAWAPNVDSAGIGVGVTDGVVTLSGDVSSLTERTAAVAAARRVAGVRTVADELRLPAGEGEPSGHKLAAAVDGILAWTTGVPHEGITADVHGHRVVLSGTVDWDWQRVAAKKAVERIFGVHEVESRIELTRRPEAGDVREQIRSAIVRSAILDAARVQVTVDGSEVTLTGRVGSWLERSQAVRTAWASPHVTAVHDLLVVDTGEH
ncbi:BON domain-containing protein [Leifsonia xyli]|uniref:BON domain-containing protein n=1 Tax=Leifsonia xyli TaxID=1575 RepID=UPI003D673021